MKPHPNMNEAERKAYREYVFSHDLTPEESKAYMEYLSDSEEKYGCDTISISLDGLAEKSDDEIWEMILQKRQERRQRNAAKGETA